MTSVNHQLVIIDYYKSLVQRVDVYTEEQLELYSNDRLIEIANETENVIELEETNLKSEDNLLENETERKVFYSPSTNERRISDYAIELNWPRERPFKMETKNYFNFIRDELIKQIELVEKETLEYYETIKDELRLRQNENITEEELKRKLFAKRSAFLFSRSNLNPFTLYLVIFDFYFDKIHEESLR